MGEEFNYHTMNISYKQESALQESTSNLDYIRDIENKYHIKFSNKELDYPDEIIKIFESETIDYSEYSLENKYVVGLINQKLFVDENFENILPMLELGSQMDNSRSIFLLGIYYYFILEIHDKAKELFTIGSIKGHLPSICYLARYYFEIENNPNIMKVILEKAIEMNFKEAMCQLGNYYLINENNIKLAKKYLHMGINKGCEISLVSLGSYYLRINKYKKAYKYLYKGIKTGSSFALYELGYYYFYNNNFDRAIDYLEKASEKNLICAQYTLSVYYMQIKIDIEQTKKYAIMLFLNNKVVAMKLYTEYFKNRFSIFSFIEFLEEIYDNTLITYVKEKIMYYKKYNKYVINYYEQLDKVNTEKKECPICYEDKSSIKFSCGHPVCSDCYKRLYKCYYRCENDEHVPINLTES